MTMSDFGHEPRPLRATLDLDSYRSWLRPSEDGKTATHLGCRLTPAGLRIFAEDCNRLADELEKAAADD